MPYLLKTNSVIKKAVGERKKCGEQTTTMFYSTHLYGAIINCYQHLL